MVRACVALACGLAVVPDFWSSRKTDTPLRPSSFASIRPHGPPPTMTTSTLFGSTDRSGLAGHLHQRPLLGLRLQCDMVDAVLLLHVLLQLAEDAFPLPHAAYVH